MKLDEIAMLVPEVLYDVGEIVGKDVSGFEVMVDYSRKIETKDKEMSRLEKEIIDLSYKAASAEMEREGWTVKMIAKANLKFRQLIQAIELKAALMYYDGGNVIYVTRLGKRMNKDSTKVILAHEIVHFLDNQFYNTFEIKKRLLTGMRKNIADYLNSLTTYCFSTDPFSLDMLSIKTYQMESFITLQESHAAYIQEKYAEKKGLNPDARLESAPLWLKIMQVLFPIEDDKYSPLSPYTRGRRVIEAAERENIDFGVLLNNLPTPPVFTVLVNEYIDSLKRGETLYTLNDYWFDDYC